MIHLLDNYKYPPYHYLTQVLQNCPKAGLTYMMIWENKNSENALQVKKKNIRDQFLLSVAKFRHDLLLLVREGLININETPDNIYIDMVDWNVEDEDTAC